MTRITTRSVMLEVLNEHPQGLSPGRLDMEVRKRRSISVGGVKQVLCHLVNQQHLVKRLPRRVCQECGHKHAVYAAKTQTNGDQK